MTIWDDQHRQLWFAAVNTDANLGAAADHDPTPAMLDGAGRDADRARAALKEHVARLGGVDAVLEDPATPDEFAAIASRAKVWDGSVDTMLRYLR